MIVDCSKVNFLYLVVELTCRLINSNSQERRFAYPGLFSHVVSFAFNV